jgi:hypothetical protein
MLDSKLAESLVKLGKFALLELTNTDEVLEFTEVTGKYNCNLEFSRGVLLNESGLHVQCREIVLTLRTNTTGNILHVIKILRSDTLLRETGKEWLLKSISVYKGDVVKEDIVERRMDVPDIVDFLQVVSVIRSEAQKRGLLVLVRRVCDRLLKIYKVDV